MATARTLSDPATPPAGTLALLCGWALLWCAAAFAGYVLAAPYAGPDRPAG